MSSVSSDQHSDFDIVEIVDSAEDEPEASTSALLRSRIIVGVDLAGLYYIRSNSYSDDGHPITTSVFRRCVLNICIDFNIFSLPYPTDEQVSRIF